MRARAGQEVVGERQVGLRRQPRRSAPRALPVDGDGPAVKVPANLRGFFAAKASRETSAASSCCSASEQTTCCEPAQKSSCSRRRVPAGEPDVGLGPGTLHDPNCGIAAMGMSDLTLCRD